MTVDTKAALVATALAGLFAGSLTACGGGEATPTEPAAVVAPAATPADPAVAMPAAMPGMEGGQAAMGAPHECKGMNECKGQGGCGSGDGGCKGKNTCKGKGGCKTS